jgi:hypothetical protein
MPHPSIAWRRYATVVLAVLALLVVPTPAAKAAPSGPVSFGGSDASGGAQALEGEAPICTPYLARFLTPNPGGVRGTVRVDYGGEVECNFFLAAGYGQTYLIDRTNNSSTRDQGIDLGAEFEFYDDYYGRSLGDHTYDGRNQDGGRQMEVALYLELYTIDGSPWGECGELPAGVRYVSSCVGVGTETLKVIVGTGNFNTGLGPYAALPVPRDALPRSEYADPHHTYPSSDLPVEPRTPVYAVRGGTVSYTTTDTGPCGRGIYIQADSVFYLYCHLTTRSVAAGDQVISGDQLGTSGNSPGTVRPHLHYEIRAGRGVGTRYCPQNQLLAIYDGNRVVPRPTTLPTTGCFYASRTRVSVNKSNFAVGDLAQYFVTGAEPFSGIHWSSTFNGVDTGEDTFYGHVTDANGNWSGYGGAWTGGQVGNWTKTIRVDGGEATVAFSVSSGPAQSTTLTMDKTSYLVGETPLYTVRNAPPNSPVYWSSTVGGNPTGEVRAFYGHYTDSGGNWSGYGGTWTDANVGVWTKTVDIGSQSSTYMFSVNGA